MRLSPELKACLGCSPKACGEVSVYVMDGHSSGCVKVGYSRTPSDRAYQLRRQHEEPGIFVAFKVKLRCEFWAMDIEQSAHAKLEGLRRFGEWFDCSLEEAVRAIEEAIGEARDV